MGLQALCLLAGLVFLEPTSLVLLESFAGGRSGTFSRSASLVFVLSRDLSSARQAGVGLRNCCVRRQLCDCGEVALHVTACFLLCTTQAVRPRAVHGALVLANAIAEKCKRAETPLSACNQKCHRSRKLFSGAAHAAELDSRCFKMCRFGQIAQGNWEFEFT